MNPQPEISVVMPVWNAEIHLREAIASILNQTFRNFEFLIIDDGSSDSTQDIVAEYAATDPRIRLILMEHGGIVRALNRGVAETRAEWIARMDSDDISHPTRLEKQWRAIQKQPNAVLCHCHTRIIGDPALVTPAGRFIRTKALLALRLCFQCPIVHPTVMFHKQTFLECGGYQESQRHAEDYGLWGRLLVKGEVVGVAEPSLDFRVHGSSISKRNADTQLSLSEKLAIQHCSLFMDLDHEEAKRMYHVFRRDHSQKPARDWLWFLFLCLPRMRWQSLEMWAWALRYTPKFISLKPDYRALKEA